MRPPVLILDPSLNRAEIPAVCQLMVRMLAASDTDVVVCDLSAITQPDLVVVEALARLRLLMIGYGGQLRLRGVVPRLRDLLVLTGLEKVLLDGSGWQAEEGEQPGGVEERVDPDDPVA